MFVPDGAVLEVRADANVVKQGLIDNLIVDAFADTPAAAPGKPAQNKKRISLGVLPAIPFEVSAR